MTEQAFCSDYGHHGRERCHVCGLPNPDSEQAFRPDPATIELGLSAVKRLRAWLRQLAELVELLAPGIPHARKLPDRRERER